jgi:putative membrane protein
MMTMVTSAMGLLPPALDVGAQPWHSGTSFHPWFFFGLGFWILPIIVFGVIVFLVARWLASPKGYSGNNTGLTILEERYARGEITKEQFAQMKRDLQR